MENKMENRENKASQISIEGIVRNKYLFEIPPYQRLYEWDKEQIEILLEDVKKAYKEQKEQYYIGNVVVSKEGDKYILIDGQQRLTTLFLIGIYLAKELQENWKKFIQCDKKLRISMPLRENEEELIKDRDFDNLSIHKKIRNGWKTIEKWFKDFKDNKTDSNALESYAEFLYKNVCFALVELAEGTDLNQFFVRMNNRGKQLEKHEILKARLLGVLREEDGVLNNNQSQSDEWKKYAKIWDLCSDMDKYIFQSASDRVLLSGKGQEEDIGANDTLASILGGLQCSQNQQEDISDNDEKEKVKSIIDFPTFLLHIAKLVLEDDKDKILIDKDKLLEMINLKEAKKVKEFILAILRYRILFDYFVIKRMVDENLEKSGEYLIRRLKKEKSYYLIGSEVMENLAMIQNYLRVARAGDKQNYHHWLTPFLKEIGNKVEGFLEVEKCLECENCFEQLEKFSTEKESLEGYSKVFVQFLEKLDNALAMKQVEGGEQNEWDFLNQGTGTPHYWFYRLEYYLWKDEGIDGKSIEEIRKNYRFRALNSVEHIHPQSQAKGWEKEKGDIDNFGNLALISQSFNSSLSDQSIEKKFVDIQERIETHRVESLKMYLAYAQCERKSGNWTSEKAKEHRKAMVEILKKSLKEE